MTRIVGLVTTNYLGDKQYEVTVRRPLAALPVLGRYRMLDFALSNLVNAGIDTLGIILPTNYRSIVDHVKSGKDWNLDRKHAGLFYLPGSAYGMARTGDGHFLLRDFLDNCVFLERERDSYIVISSGSLIYNMDYVPLVEAHAASGADITVVTQKAQDPATALMSFEIENGEVLSYKQGVQPGDNAFLDTFVISGKKFLELLGWFEVVEHLDFFEAISADKSSINVRAYEYNLPAFPIFTLEEYYRNSMRLLDPELSGILFDWARPVRTKAHDNPPAKYESGAKVSYSMVSGGSIVAGSVENSILGRNVIVEPGASIKNSIIFQNCVIKARAKIDYAIIDKNNTVPEKAELKGTLEHLAVQEKVLTPALTSDLIM